MRVRQPDLSTSTHLGEGRQQPVRARVEPHPLNALLFGRRAAPLVDPRRYPHLKKALRKLQYMKEEISELLGAGEEDYTIALAEGGNASISREGVISFGAELLERHQDDDDLLLAILGHEIGHRPETWPAVPPRLSRHQLSRLYRDEEAKADGFAGRILADLGARPDSACDFLLAAKRFEKGRPPVDYYPAEVRAEMIRAAYDRRRRLLRLRHHRNLRALR